MKNNPYRNAVAQLEKVAKIIKLEDAYLKRLSVPDRVVEVNIPVWLENKGFKLFKGYRSQHNNTLGPYKGGIRFSPSVTKEEVMALSMWMSWKTSASQLPYGGGKGGVIVDTKDLTAKDIEYISRGYIKGIADCIGPKKDVPAPDMYTTPEIMNWMVDEYSKIVGEYSPTVITGKPIDKGGSEGRTEATGYGGVYILEELVKMKGMNPENTTIAIQGIGNVGYYFFELAKQLGFKIVALTDSKGGKYNDNGDLDLGLMLDEKALKSASIKDLSESYGDAITNDELLELDVDVLVPAAIENVITKENANKIKAKYIIEMANGPVTPEADSILCDKGIISVPDIIANAGGVIVSYYEWVQNLENEKWEKEIVLDKMKKKIQLAFRHSYDASEKFKTDLRMGAYALAVKKIADKM